MYYIANMDTLHTL